MVSLYPLLLAIGIGGTPISTAPTTEARYLDGVLGTWDGQFRPSVVFVNMRVERDRTVSTYGHTYALGELSDLRREKRAVGFELHRSAGSFRFDGAARDLRASGTFEFIPNTAYKRAVEKLGYRKLNRHHQLAFAMHDITLDELRQLRRIIRGKPMAADAARLFEHGVSPEYVRDLAGVGFAGLSIDALIRVREAGVNADYVRGLRAEGLRLTLPEYLKARARGLTTEYVRQLESVGLRELSLAEYYLLLDNDVTAEYASSIYALGYAACDLDDLVRLRNHGITAGFIIKANKQAGEQLSVSELIRYRTRGEY
jgi:hypothetical protein